MAAAQEGLMTLLLWFFFLELAIPHFGWFEKKICFLGSYKEYLL